jgi:hypothetical protein
MVSLLLEGDGRQVEANARLSRIEEMASEVRVHFEARTFRRSGDQITSIQEK